MNEPRTVFPHPPKWAAGTSLGMSSLSSSPLLRDGAAALGEGVGIPDKEWGKHSDPRGLTKPASGAPNRFQQLHCWV